MKSRAKTKPAEPAFAPVSAPERPLSRADEPVVQPTLAALVDLAEELGRLSARHELERIIGRSAYSLPELLLGACVVAGLWMLIARMLGWFAP